MEKTYLAPASIIAPDFMLVQVVTGKELPSFFTNETRPAYVGEDVRAIFPAHIILIKGQASTYHHYAVVRFAQNLGRDFARIAEDHHISTSIIHNL